MKCLLLSCLTFLAFLARPAAAARDFNEVIAATEQILAGRSFKNEDGVIISFSSLRRSRSTQDVSLQVDRQELDQPISSYLEVIRKDADQVIIDEISGGSVIHSFLASVEEPYHVLRMRPINGPNSELISRECFLQEGGTLHVCYYKLRCEGGVFTSVFREIPKS